MDANSNSSKLDQQRAARERGQRIREARLAKVMGYMEQVSYQPCGHPVDVACGCNGRLFAGYIGHSLGYGAGQ